MKIIECVQGQPEWLAVRLGRPTASRADQLLTPKTRKPAAARFKYRAELLAEWLLGYPLDGGSSVWMERGSELEAEARKWYAFDRGVDVREVGFLLTDDERYGGSPDGLIGDDGIIEIKVPSAVVHVGRMLGEDHEHNGQCQALLYVSARSWVDLISYNPVLPPVVTRIERDEAYIAALAEVIDSFVAGLELDKAALAEYRNPVRLGMVA